MWGEARHRCCRWAVAPILPSIRCLMLLSSRSPWLSQKYGTAAMVARLAHPIAERTIREHPVEQRGQLVRIVGIPQQQPGLTVAHNNG